MGSEWQPIESAPKADIAVLLFSSHIDFIESAARLHAEQISPGFYEDGVWYWAGTGHDVFEDGVTEWTPTHWMPMPLAPTVSEIETVPALPHRSQR